MKFKFPFKKKEKVDRIAALEARIFSAKKTEETGKYVSLLNSIWSWDYNYTPKTLEERLEDQKKDFEELDRKFDALERYLQIEYYKEDTETQVYDWADKKHSEGFRKAPKKYEEMKAEKEAAKKAEHECD